MAEELIVDARWTGQHGIARYAKSVLGLLPNWIEFSQYERGRPSALDAVGLRLHLRSSGARAFYSPGFHPAFGLRETKQVLTVHDLIHLDVPQESSFAKSLYMHRLVRGAVVNAGLVFTVSDFSRRRIAEAFHIPDDIIVNAGVGCDPVFLDESVGQGSTSTMGRPYILFVGNQRPHKRLDFLLRAMRFVDPEFHLICVGSIDVRYFRKLPESVKSRVQIRRGVSDRDLAQLYRNAVVVAVPSLVEGFGLPALEAAAAGAPVVYCSEAVQEIVRHTGIRVSARSSPEEFAAAVLEATELPPELRAARRDLALSHNWPNVVKRIANEIMEVLEH